MSQNTWSELEPALIQPENMIRVGEPALNEPERRAKSESLP